MKRFSSELSRLRFAIQSIEQFIGAIVAYKSLVTLKLCTVNLLLYINTQISTKNRFFVECQVWDQVILLVLGLNCPKDMGDNFSTTTTI